MNWEDCTLSPHKMVGFPQGEKTPSALRNDLKEWGFNPKQDVSWT